MQLRALTGRFSSGMEVYPHYMLSIRLYAEYEVSLSADQFFYKQNQYIVYKIITIERRFNTDYMSDFLLHIP